MLVVGANSMIAGEAGVYPARQILRDHGPELRGGPRRRRGPIASNQTARACQETCPQHICIVARAIGTRLATRGGSCLAARAASARIPAR